MAFSKDLGQIQLVVGTVEGLDILRARAEEFLLLAQEWPSSEDSEARICRAVYRGLSMIADVAAEGGIAHAALQMHLKLTSGKPTLTRTEQRDAMDVISKQVIPLMEIEGLVSSNFRRHYQRQRAALIDA